MGFGDTRISTIIYAMIFTLLGYLLYATLAACLGSIVSSSRGCSTSGHPDDVSNCSCIYVGDVWIG